MKSTHIAAYFGYTPTSIRDVITICASWLGEFVGIYSRETEKFGLMPNTRCGQAYNGDIQQPDQREMKNHNIFYLS